jgi:hypothetical protein
MAALWGLDMETSLVSESITAQLALAISIAVALWNLVRYLLEGGRVRVRLRSGLLYDYALADADSWPSLAKATEGRGGWSAEVAVIDIENVGRTAVTISAVSLDLGPTSWRPWARRTIGPMPLTAPEASTEARFRLEPFDRVRYVFDVWQVLSPSTSRVTTPERPLRVRGSVRVAGKRGARRSPWRSAWRVVDGQVAFLPELVEIGMATYRAMWRHLRGDTFAEITSIQAAIEVRENFPSDGPPPTKEALRIIIDSVHVGDQSPMAHLAAYYVAKELRTFYAESVEEERELSGNDTAPGSS